MAEVIKVVGDLAYVQVFESTRGLKPGMPVEFQNHMLEVSLGPGLLSKNFDGLQNDLDKMTGVFLKRGEYTNPLEDDKKWSFTPLAKAGDKVKAADWLGNVKENWLDHKIMVPFKLEGEYTVVSVVPAGEYTILDTIAVLKDRTGKEINVTMVQKWPVKVAIRNYVDKPRPVDGNGCSGHRYHEPDAGRGNRIYSGTVRYGKDGVAACFGPFCGCRCDYHGCLR